MIKVSDLLSKPLITLSEAKVVGTIGNIVFDDKLKKGRFLELLNDEETEPERKYVEMRRVNVSGNDAAVIPSLSAVTNVWDTAFTPNNPINKPAYNQDGKKLGRICDVLLESQSVSGFLLDGGTELKAETLLTYSDNLVIFNDSGKPVKLPKTKIKLPEAARATPVAVAAGSTPQKVISKQNEISSDMYSGYRFLIGKTVSGNLVSQNGELIARDGQTVSAEMIEKAKSAGRLVQLALHAL